jgi:hypothetical protein|tara:strand:+ start:241 stop:486 length:246 start_codon:yes stop_codon:yes gene_type:complete
MTNEYGMNVEGTKRYDTRHGGAYDRGSADSYYHRPRRPHYFEGGTNKSNHIPEELMSNDEIEAYNAGYEYNEETGDKKDWG